MTNKGHASAMDRLAKDTVLPWAPGIGDAERRAATDYAMERVPLEGCDEPIARLFHLLPWGGGGDDAVTEIAANMLMAPTLEAASAPSVAGKIGDYLDQWITIHDVRMRPGEKEGGNGCFAVLDVTAGPDGHHKVVTTGATGVLFLLARAYLEDALPLICMPVEVETGKKGRSNPLYLRASESF